MACRFYRFRLSVSLIFVSALLLARPCNAQSNSQSCGSFTDLGYSLHDGGHAYRVKGSGPLSPLRPHAFFDEKGAQVLDASTVDKLAAAAWAKELIVDRYSPSTGSAPVRGFLNAYSSLRHWQEATDVLARVTVESIELVATSGDGAAEATVRLGTKEAQQQLADPSAVLAHFVRAGLEQSLADYMKMEEILGTMDRANPKVADLNSIRTLYQGANGLSSVAEEVGASVAPLSTLDVVHDYLASARQEIGPNGLTVAIDTLGLLQFFAKSSNALQQSLTLVHELNASNEGIITEWAAAAGRLCVPTSAGGPPVSNQPIAPPLHVDGISPSSMFSARNTALTITGSGFRNGMTVSIRTPSGTVDLAPSMITVLSPDEFRVALILPATPMSYVATLSISAPDSAVVTVSVQVLPSATSLQQPTSTNPAPTTQTPLRPPVASVPTQFPSPLRITSVSPGQVRVGQITTVTLVGTGFQVGSSVSEAGGSLAMPLSVSSLSPTSIAVRIQVKGPAPYYATLRIQSPSGQVATATFQVIP